MSRSGSSNGSATTSSPTCCSCWPSIAVLYARPPSELFARYKTEVREEWIDYNGHLNDAGYALVLSEANEVLLADLGLSEDYRARTGRATYTVESHIRDLAEAHLVDELEAPSLEVRAVVEARRVGHAR